MKEKNNIKNKRKEKEKRGRRKKERQQSAQSADQSSRSFSLLANQLSFTSSSSSSLLRSPFLRRLLHHRRELAISTLFYFLFIFRGEDFYLSIWVFLPFVFLYLIGR